MKEIINLNSNPIKQVLEILLKDKTTNKNIIWATKSYQEFGEIYTDRFEITKGALIGMDPILIQPRANKTSENQHERTKSRAEVFTPAWIVNKMNNEIGKEWFNEEYPFNLEKERIWIRKNDKIIFSKDMNWKKYVDIKVLEIAYGEAPFIVSRYDASSGEVIPIEDRVGILDRKFRIINENAATDQEWLKYAKRAVESVYGFEFQGDNVLIGRINILLTYVDYYKQRFHSEPEYNVLKSIANIISWNFWQMDGLKYCVPIGVPESLMEQITLFDFDEEEKEEVSQLCQIYDWRKRKTILFEKIGKDKNMAKFDVVIGNPPYQVEAPGTSTSDKPIYHLFWNEAEKIGDIVELITPGRFLFNAGATPKTWNEMMLNDSHCKVEMFEQKSNLIFPGTDIKGGVTIVYRNKGKKLGPIGVFTPFVELNSIILKVKSIDSLENSLDDEIYVQNKFDLDILNAQVPDLNRKDKRLESNAFKLPVFTKEKKNLSDYQILGLENGHRVYKYCDKNMIDTRNSNIRGYKVIVPKSNGSGAIGEVLSTPLIGTPLIGTPLIGYTRTFIGIGNFNAREPAENLLKYIKTKFARVMLGVLKITQDNNPGKWKYVPLQDFTEQSDIDWSKSIPEIDQQLYKKYGLSPEEIEFIETHVKEME